MEKKLKQQFDGWEINPSDSLWQRIEAELPEGELEYKLRMQLHEQEIIPSGRTWEAIARELPNTPEQMPTFKYWGLASILGVALVAGIGYWFSINEITQSKQIANHEVETAVASADELSIRVNETTIDKNESGNQSLKKVLPDADVKSKNAKVLQMQTNESSQTSKSFSNTSTFSDKKDVKKKITALNNKPTAQSTIVKRGRSLSMITHYNDNTGDRTSSLLNAKQQPVSEQKETTIQTPTTVSEDNIIAQKSTTESNIIDLNTEPKTNVLASGNVLQDTVLQAPLPATLLTDEEELTPYSITATVGINYSMMRLALPSGAARYPLHENKALRQSVEQPSFDFAFSFMVDYTLNDRMRISSGIGRVIFNQQFYYNITQPLQVPSHSERVENISFTNDSIITGNTYQSNIRYAWTEIPLLFTYNFNPHKKMYYAIQAGCSYGMLNTVQSAMVNYDNVGILILDNQNSFPGFRNNVFAIINPTLAYKIKPDVELMFQPAFRFALNSMVANEKWLQQYPMLAGLNVALRKRF